MTLTRTVSFKLLELTKSGRAEAKTAKGDKVGAEDDKAQKGGDVVMKKTSAKRLVNILTVLGFSTTESLWTMGTIYVGGVATTLPKS